MATENASSSAIVGIVAIIAILIVVALALEVFQLYPNDRTNDNVDDVNIDVNIPPQQNPY